MRILPVLAASVALAGYAAPATAATLVFSTVLSGANEVPPNASPGTGLAVVTVDTVANTIAFNVSFAGLLGTTTAAHVHCCTPPGANAGVAVGPGTLPGFPLGVTSGTYSNSLSLLDSATYTSAVVTNFGGGTVAGARDAIIARMSLGQTYFNVHTGQFPGGEIRGQLAAVPEPGTWAMLILGFGAIGCSIRWRSRRRLTPA